MSLEHSPSREKRRPPHASFSIDEFCEAERISKSELYKLWRERKGPRFYYVGVNRKITPEARADWQREREAEAEADWRRAGEAEAA
jgi:hypothetical protein